MKARLLIVVLLTFSLIACIGGRRDTSKETSSEEKADVYLKLGVTYLNLGKLNIAKESLEKALSWDSRNANIHNAMAVLYERIEKLDVADSHYQKALDLEPENHSTKNNYGRFLCEQGQYAQGISHLTMAFKMPLNERKWLSLVNAGRCKLQQKDVKTAEQYFRQALALHSMYSPALLEMQKLSYHKNNYLSARAFLQRYLNVAQETAETLWYAYHTERALGDLDSANKYRQKLYSKFPNSTQSQQLKSVVQ